MTGYLIRCKSIFFVAALSIFVSRVIAQDGRLGSELDLLRNDEIREQLNLSETQLSRLAEASQGASPGREFFDPYLQRMKETSSEEERTKIREEMTAATAKAREAASGAAFTILDSRQLNLLRTLFIQQAGVRALSDARVAADLKLTPEQIKAISELATKRRDASAKMNYEADEEAQIAFQKEWETRYLAVLTAEQKLAWEALAGPSLSAADSGMTPGSDISSRGAGTIPGEGATVISSFGGVPDANGELPRVELFSFNFRYAAWEQVLQDFAAGAGYTLDLNKVPTGTFSHIDGKEYTAGQTMDILNGYLQRRGFALVLKDGFLVSVSTDKGIPPNLIPDVDLERLVQIDGGVPAVGENEIVRIEIPLEKLDVGVMAQEVEALLGPLGTMTAFTQTGSLIIADTGSNLRRIKKYVEASVSRRKGDLVFRTYPLVNIDAEEAEFMLLSQFGMRQGVTNVSAGGGDRRRGSPEAPPAASASTSLQVMSDSRTNSLFVTGSPDQQTLVEEIIKAIDISEAWDGTKLSRRGNSGPYLRVYKVAGRADQVAQSITAMMPGVVVNEDREAGTVHIFANARQQEQVEEWVKAFASGTGATGSVAVIPLIKMDPLSAAATLRSLFYAEGTAAPTVETDLYGNRIIVKGTSVQVEQIRQVLRDLGEDGTGVKNRGEGGNIRRYSLRGRDPDEFLNYFEQQWQATESNAIRIVYPKKSGPIRGLKTPSDTQSARDPAPTSPEVPTRPGTPANVTPRDLKDSSTDSESESRERRTADRRKNSGYLTVVQNSSGLTEDLNGALRDASERVNPVRPRVGDTPPEDFQAEGIQIVVDGDELLLFSRDEDALDRLEEKMDYLQQSIPFRTRWTVFYLQAADATEAAALLEQFIPSSSVTNMSASSGFSLSSMFSPITQSVSNLTGLSGLGSNPQQLRIIPDPRSNSLFVTGPQSLIEDAERFLEVIDSNDIPESLRDLQPRRIVVEYAEIEDVLTMVTDSFKPYLEPVGGRQQQNPLAQMFGGGGNSNNPNQPQGVQMTITADRQASALIVSSNEALFNKVQAMVREADEAAQQANRTIRVVQLKHSDAATIQQSLTSMFPRVTSSATRSSSRGSSGSDSGSAAPAPSAQAPTDPFQQMIQERMRQRGGDSGGRSSNPFGGGMSPFGGGGGGSPFGGGGGASPFSGRRGR